MKKLIELIKGNYHHDTVRKKAQELRSNGVLTKRELEIIIAFIK